MLPEEDVGAYENLQKEIIRALAPENMIEHIFARDIVDLTWEGLRLRRMKTTLMTAMRHEGIDLLLEPLEVNWDLPAFAAGKPAATKQVEKILSLAGISKDTIVAATMLARLREFAQIDQMIAQTEARRQAALQQLERHRAVRHLVRRPQLQDRSGPQLRDRSGALLEQHPH